METTLNDELTFKIIGSAMKVHAQLRSGFQDVIYQRALIEQTSLLRIKSCLGWKQFQQ